MPNRILRDWTDSEIMNNLSVHAERFFVRLIMKADDYGRFYANVKLLKSNLFPLSDTVRDADVSRWMAECQKAGLILVYEVNQKLFLQIENFKQRLDRAKEKYPPPPINCKSAVNDFPEVDIDFPPETETETESRIQKPKQNPEAETGARSLVFPFSSERFLTTWEVLKNEPKWKKKTFAALQTCLKQLSQYPESDAIKMMENSIAGGWQGLFELKPHEKTVTNATNQFTGTPGQFRSEADRKAAERAQLRASINEKIHGSGTDLHQGC